MRFRIPKDIGVAEITADRDRAEVTDVVIGWINRDDLPMIDGNITPEQKDNNPYKIAHPGEFSARADGFYLFVDATWRWGTTPGQSIAKMTVDYYDLKVIVSIWTANGEGSNTRVIFHLNAPIRSALLH